MTIPALLIRGGQLYAPESRGVQDVLIVNDRVAAVGQGLTVPSWANGTVLDAAGLLIFPGLVDQHVHITGGGGEGGPQYRTPELFLSDLTRYGLTTVVGVLGTDGTTRSVQELLAKARALAWEGLNCWLYTGAYEVPTRTITDSPRNDLILIDRIVGIGEIAVSDHRGSHPSDRELAHLAGEARTGGLLGGKAGVLHLHVGSGHRRLEPLMEVLDLADIPITTMVPTHLNRTRTLLEDAVRYGRRGGYLDVTTSIAPNSHDQTAVDPVDAVKTLLAAGIELRQISFSTDAGGSAPVFDAKGHLRHMGVGTASSLFASVRRLHDEAGMAWSDAIRPATATPAAILQMADVGVIAPGARGDVVVTDGTQIVAVAASGRVMVQDGRAVVFGLFESSREENR
jgi:beta-aspartyl-dipeptidase (metallo-type)